jgi:uncharacterized protein (PEP-CTERM system associated)
MGSRLRGNDTVVSLVAVAAFALGIAPAAADQWKVEPGVRGTITYTDNVALAAPGREQSSGIIGIAPRIAISGKGSRYSVNGTYALSANYYTNADRSDSYYSSMNLFGNVEAIERFFYVDGGVNILQNFFSPLGPITIDNALDTGNRYTTYVYRLNPYLQGQLRGDTNYLLRWNNTWTDYSRSGLRESYIYDVIGRLGRPSGLERRLGWGLEYDRNYVKYNEQEGFTRNVGRGILSYQLTPELQVSGRGGYESNDYSINGYSDWIYGAGVDWRPTARTVVNGFWEHRFFGDSYSANFQHRHRLFGWRLTGSRNVTTSAQQLPLGTGLAYDVVDAAFAGRIADPAEREQAVLQFLQQTGLPPILTEPIVFYNNQIFLQERVESAVSINGVRNNVVLTVYWTDREPITGGGTPLPPLLTVGQDYVQQGASANYTYRLTGTSNVSLLALRNHTRYRAAALPGSTDYTLLRALFTSSISRRTSWFAGVRYQWRDPSNASFSEYREAAVYGGIDYTYR